MPGAANRRAVEDDAPSLDPLAVQRAYRLERARRRARTERERARRAAAVRFFASMAALVGLTVFLGLVIWQQVERLFGV